MIRNLHKNELLRILMPGGIIFRRDLKNLMKIARELGNKEIIFGSRQDIMFPAGKSDAKTLSRRFGEIPLDFEWGSQKHQNIVTSYAAVDIMPTTSWVTSGTYHYVLEYFKRKHRLKINITDPAQSLVPLFSGDLNFVASGHEDYWYLYLRASKNTKLYRWPVLIHSPDIGPVANALEEHLASGKKVREQSGRNSCITGAVMGMNDDGDWSPEAVDRLFRQIDETLQTDNRIITSPLKLSNIPFPYYEGLNMGSGGKYWLGLYWRNNRYDIRFLEKVCDLCEQTDTGRLIITPWKSFIIKDIEKNDARKWEYLCGVNGINFRHSSIELNWHLPVLDAGALKLKNYLVREFNRQDVSTYGLTFSINTRPEDSFTSVVITREPNKPLFGKFGIFRQYTVYYRKDFNPNEQTFIPFEMNVSRSRLPAVMTALSRYYFEKVNLNEQITRVAVAGGSGHSTERKVHQCKFCLTGYDSQQGDPPNGIAPGTPFLQLPTSYTCSLCDAGKTDFIPALLQDAGI